MNIQQALAKVVEQIDLSIEEMQEVMRQIMTGGATDAQIGGFLVALRMKSESLDEITGGVQVMRELVTAVPVQNRQYLVDIVGTGGDGANLFNVSSASAFVAAAAGARVAKHGGRSVSSKSGSADLLETAGIALDLTPEQIGSCVDNVGVGFMFAPNHHKAMKYAVGPRKELGMRTLFNILGPMTNPAGVQRLVLGVFSEKLCRPMAEVMGRLGAEHVMVVHSRDGLDEISLATRTHVAEFRNGEISEYEVTPEDLGLDSDSLVGLDVTDSDASLALIRDAFGKRSSDAARKAADMIALNAGAAIYVSGITRTHKEGVRMAEDLIHNGEAAERMRELAQYSTALTAAD
ncbi:MAG: anthranilate phosphoribosyltransferase [Alcanivorax sp.]|jgi:anthranilate phosphoribosyltransferase|uniref:anthranilate phosphoribosyltransferase n=1 Tax=Alcanivorax TaxID=59753 RepID=UPI000C388D1C|nr:MULTISPECIES: anthranilate phosphoribosyltransferase [Alcanivorax]MAC13361.1 anthranilate phosphoribosyltransferase [Alcanivorax sp.]MBG31804.1 anthranilate phosphoribosyltransferase [Alcanivorax sp.]MDF1637082.1 anthranilate phosphoribosyltransferase [Alcanivorax jadensis]|tara:strand:+ start:297 stop:1340 length:1044 start_codon:yes stop_codon:yes gene_type:complete